MLLLAVLFIFSHFNKWLQILLFRLVRWLIWRPEWSLHFIGSQRMEQQFVRILLDNTHRCWLIYVKLISCLWLISLLARHSAPLNGGFFLAPAEGRFNRMALRPKADFAGRTDKQTDGRTDRQIDGQTDGQTNRRTDGRTKGLRELDLG